MDAFGTRLPHLTTEVPGPRSRALGVRLRAVESRNVTFLGDHFPVFWDEALGANVRDADGNVHLDLTAAFGVALVGHAAPEVVEALSLQAKRLLHGMGDVHPPIAKVELLEALARVLPWPDSRAVLATSGSEAVEIALKTGRIASGRPGVIAFSGGYHGLTLGALAVTARDTFRRPVAERLFPGVAHLAFPGAEVDPELLATFDRVLEAGTVSGPVGTVIIEPVQARGGVRVVPGWFAEALMERVRSHDLVLIADEIYSGLGRCGAVLASPRVGLDPDVVCLGKVLGGGVPIGVCVAPARIMDAWPESDGEALHTSTFLGHPLACAAAGAVLSLLERGLADQAEALGRRIMVGLLEGLADLIDVGAVEVRGLGLLIGVEVRDGTGTPLDAAGVAIAERLLAVGVLALPAGDSGAVIELSPPVVLTDDQVEFAIAAVVRAVRAEVE